MEHSSYIELSKSALRQNLDFLRSVMGSDTNISSVVKGNAYGHGVREFVPMACGCGINHFSVFSADEALNVSESCDEDFTLMIMGFVEGDELAWAIENDVEFFVFDKIRFDDAIGYAKKIGKKAKMHVEVETGMNRTGFNEVQLTELIPAIQNNLDVVEFKGICTHYAGAESISNYLRIKRQYKKYKQACIKFERSGLKPVLKHTACSAAAMTYPKSRMDLARIGIMQYGLWPGPETFIQYVAKKEDKKDPLRRVINWKSKVMSTKEVASGEFIGYGTSFLAHVNMKIAVVPVGYANGYSRSLSNQGRVIINGHRVAVVGRVNMNMLVADISEIPHTRKGDEVVLIGKQEDMHLSIASFSEYSNQLNYELLTRLPKNIPRKVID
jgi:alanine racemase